MSEYTVIADDAAFQAAPKVFTKKEDGTYEEVPKDGLTFEADKYYTPNEVPAADAAADAAPAAESAATPADNAAAAPADNAAAAPAVNNLPEGVTEENVKAIAGVVKNVLTQGGRRTKRKQQKKGKSAKKGGKKHRKTSGKKSRRSSSKKSRRHGRK